MAVTLQSVKDILTEATTILCDNLRPEDGLLRALKTAKAISADHDTIIKKETTDTSKVEKLIEILMRSPVSSYEAFMSSLEKERNDIYKEVMDIQKKHCGKISCHIQNLCVCMGSVGWFLLIKCNFVNIFSNPFKDCPCFEKKNDTLELFLKIFSHREKDRNTNVLSHTVRYSHRYIYLSHPFDFHYVTNFVKLIQT